MSAPGLTALVVARNEEARLERCLAPLATADELLVVLDRTTDDSRAVAEKFGARVIEGAWAVEGERRNIGLDAAIGDWILEVDADEIATAELMAEIREVMASSRYAWHEIPIDNYIGEKLVRYGWGGSFGTSAVPRLSRKGAKRWGMQRVHPSLQWQGTRGPQLSSPQTQYVSLDNSCMLRRLDRYSNTKAADLLASGEIGTLPANLRRLVSRFWKCFVSRRGYREGGYGLLIALCAGLYPLLAHLKARLEPWRHR